MSQMIREVLDEKWKKMNNTLSMFQFDSGLQVVDFEFVSRADFEGASSEMEAEAAKRLGTRWSLQGRSIKLLVTDNDGTKAQSQKNSDLFLFRFSF